VFSNNIRNNFGFLNRCDEQGIGQVDKLFVQQGRKVFKEVCPMVGEHIVQHLEQLGIQPQQVGRFWLHQANLAMNQLIARRVLGRDASEQEAPVILDRYANTSSAGSIIAFHLCRDRLAQGYRCYFLVWCRLLGWQRCGEKVLVFCWQLLCMRNI
jgi:beta-ketodecanoyl-[acyl-carrier-protein] synthase